MKAILILSSLTTAVAALVFGADQEASSSPMQNVTAVEHHVMNPSDLKWGEVPPGLPPGGKMAVLNGDPTKPGPFTVRLSAPAGYTINPHTHPTDERVTVISGKTRMGM